MSAPEGSREVSGDEDRPAVDPWPEGFDAAAAHGALDSMPGEWAGATEPSFADLAAALEPTPAEHTGPRAGPGYAVSLDDQELDAAGPPWVLLRGLMRDRRHWGSLPGRIGLFAEGQVVEAFDLPGNGSRCRERSPSTIGEMVDVLRSGLQRRGIETPVRVLAMSLGAMVAIEWARRHPDEVVGLVLINASVKPLSPLKHRLQPRQWGAFVRLALLPARPVDWESVVLRATSRRYRKAGSQARATLLERWVNWRITQPVSRGNALRQMWAAARYQVDTPPPVPGLLMVSARDELVDPRCSHAIAQAWGWPLTEHARAGHDLPLDDPAWVLERLRHRFEDPAAPRRRKAPERIVVDEVDMPMPSTRLRRPGAREEIVDVEVNHDWPPRLPGPGEPEPTLPSDARTPE